MEITITSEELDFLIQHLDYEISENEDLILNSKRADEKKAWIEENIFIKRLKTKLLFKQQKYEVILQQLREPKQELTAQQEDYVIEEGLERYREARDSQEERQKAINKMCEDLEK